MLERGGGFGVGDFIELDLGDLHHAGEALWAKNVIKITEHIHIRGVDYFVEQKLPFELFIIRTSPGFPSGGGDEDEEGSGGED